MAAIICLISETSFVLGHHPFESLRLALEWRAAGHFICTLIFSNTLSSDDFNAQLIVYFANESGHLHCKLLMWRRKVRTGQSHDETSVTNLGVCFIQSGFGLILVRPTRSRWSDISQSYLSRSMSRQITRLGTHQAATWTRSVLNFVSLPALKTSWGSTMADLMRQAMHDSDHSHVDCTCHLSIITNHTYFTLHGLASLFIHTLGLIREPVEETDSTIVRTLASDTRSHG